MRGYRQRLGTLKKARMKSAQIKQEQEPPKKNKYNNNRIFYDNRYFDSEKEKNRYVELRLQEKIGVISDLKFQVAFELAPAAVINGRKKPALRYYADAVYKEHGKPVIEDSKGCLTDVYKIKRHLMKVVHGVDIREI